MKVIIVNRRGHLWEFASVKKALPHIRPEKRKDYSIIRGVRVYRDEPVHR